MGRHGSIETKFPTGPQRSITFRPKFRLLLSEVGLETRIFENGTASLGWTGPTGQGGPPLEVDHFFRKISSWTEAFHLCVDRNFRKFWHNGKHPTSSDGFADVVFSLAAGFLLEDDWITSFRL